MEKTFEVLRRLGVMAQAEYRQLAGTTGLLPVHIDVLHYLARCNRYSNTPAAVGQFLDTTKGSVSQSIKLLERKGLIGKFSDAADGRVVRLKLLAKGSRLLHRVGRESRIHAAVEALPAREKGVLEAALTDLLRRAQLRNASKSFGVCKTCRFFRKQDDGGFLCGITGEPLSDDDSERICVEHERHDAEP